MYVKCNLPQPTTFKKSTVGTLTPHALHEACRASLSARPNAGRERASRDVLRDRERVLHERGRAARRRRLEAPRHLAETTRWCRASRNRKRARAPPRRVDRPRDARDRARPSGARHTHRGVVLRALLGDQEVRPDPTLPATRRVRTPGKFCDRFPALFARDRGAPTDVARVLPRARGRADRRSRGAFDPRTFSGMPRASRSDERARRTAPPAIDRCLRVTHDSRLVTTRGGANTAFFSREMF